MDALTDRIIGLAAAVVGMAAIFFASKLQMSPASNVPLMRKVFGFVIGGALILYGLYSLVAG